MTFLLLYLTVQWPEFVKTPMRVADTSCRSMIFLNAGHLLFGTASIIRSCDSESHICHGLRPEYLRGTFSRSTVNPPASRDISPTAPERQPPPISVIESYSPASRASRIRASDNFFCVIGSPICTAVAGEPFDSASDANVKPWMPSSPTR